MENIRWFINFMVSFFFLWGKTSWQNTTKCKEEGKKQEDEEEMGPYLIEPTAS